MNTLYQGDCLEVMKNIPDGSIDMILIDPPYFLKLHDWDNQWNNMDEYINWCKLWIRESFRVLKYDGAFYSFQNWKVVSEFIMETKKIFPFFQNWVTWERIKGRSSSKNWKSSKEEILYFSKSISPRFYEQKKIRPVIAPYRNPDGTPKGWFIDENGNRVRWTGVGNVWHYTPPVWSSKSEKPVHPTQKPINLLKRIILAHTKPNDVVLDFFMGSGSTGVACKHLNRNFIGIELDPKYFEIAKNRIENG